MNADPALQTYDAFAGVYNDFNHANDYELWLGHTLLPELRKYGLKEGGRALDVGCGTGRAFRPLLRRGWRVHGCDLSPAMLAIATQEGQGRVSLEVADMRDLPDCGDFDLVLSLNDSMNYLLGDRDLLLALTSMRSRLADGGLLIFDLNSRSTYEHGYSMVREVAHKGARWIWTGCGEVSASIFEAEIEGDRLDAPIRQIERFRSEDEVLGAMRAAGVEPLAVLGMSEESGEILLATPANESRDYKLVFIGASAAPS